MLNMSKFHSKENYDSVYSRNIIAKCYLPFHTTNCSKAKELSMSDETTLNFATGNSMLDAQLPTRLVSIDLFEFITCEIV